MKVLIGDTIFMSPTGEGTPIIHGHQEPREGLPVCRAKEVPSFLSYFKTLSTGPAPGIEPANPHFEVKRSANWANPANSVDWVKWPPSLGKWLTAKTQGNSFSICL